MSRNIDRFQEDEDQSHVNKKVGFGEKMVSFPGNFQPIPVVDAIVIIVVIIVLTIVFNTLVLMYYRKAKTSNRPYVLALVVLDFVCVLFIAPALLVTTLVSGTYMYILRMIRFEVGMCVYDALAHRYICTVHVYYSKTQY